MKTITVFLLFVLVGSSSFASQPGQFQWAVQRQGEMLLIHWKDKEPQINSCGLTLRRFAYFSQIRSLDLEVSRDLCPFDFLDRSQGLHIWRLPFELRAGGELRLFLSGKSVGTIHLGGDDVSLKLREGDR